MIIDDFAVSDQLWVRLLAVSLCANRLSMGIASVYKGCGFAFVFNPCNHGDVMVFRILSTQDNPVACGGDFICLFPSHCYHGDGMSSVMSIYFLLYFNSHCGGFVILPNGDFTVMVWY